MSGMRTNNLFGVELRHGGYWVLSLLLFLFAAYAQPGHAQTNGYGPPFYLSGAGDDGSHTKYPTFMAAATVVRNALIARDGPGTASCPLILTINNPPLPEYSNQELMGNVQYAGLCYADVGDIYASGSPYALGKNAGGCDCDGDNGHNGGPAPASPLKGHPINVSTGNKFEQETDYTAPNDWLTFRRFYNSLGPAYPGALGSAWRHSFDRALAINLAKTSLLAYRPGGSFRTFTKQSSGAWTADADVRDTLTEQDSKGGTATGYVLFVADTRQTEQYSAAGLLQSITDQDGTVTTLTYSTSSTPKSVAPKAGFLLTVTDPQGRTLSFTYTSTGQLNTVTQPDGGVLTYGYDSTNDLTSVQYPDGKTRQYLYNESALTGGTNLPGSLTGTIDESNTRYESTTYNSNGWATSEYRGPLAPASI